TGKMAPNDQETGPGIQADASALWQYLPDLQGILTAGLLPVQFQAPVTAMTEEPGQVPEIAGPGSLTVLQDLVQQTDSQQPGVRNGEGPGVILPGVFSDESGAVREAVLPENVQAGQADGPVRDQGTVIPEAEGDGRTVLSDGQLTDFSSRAGKNGINPPNSQNSIDITVDSETVAARNKYFPVTAAGNPEPKPGETGPAGMQYSWDQSGREQAESAPDRVLRGNEFSENTPAGQSKPAAGSEPTKPQTAQLYVEQKPAADSARAVGANQDIARVTVAADEAGSPETKPILVAQGPGSDGTREAGKKDATGSIRGDSAVSVISNGKAEDTGDRQPESQSQFQSNQSTAGSGSEMAGLDPGEGTHEAAITVSTPVFNVTARKFPAVILPHVMASLKNMTAENSRVTVIRLKLEPKNMGEIKIRLSYSNGELSAHFFTSSGLVKDAVECSLPQLKEALAQHNVSLGEAAAFVGQDQQSHKRTPGGFGQGSRDGFTRGFSGEKAVGSVITSQAWGGSSSLDLLI
ncbi:MAG: flagellar hook-length control protein FliK, partial [Desulfocucumaceae bacterium]